MAEPESSRSIPEGGYDVFLSFRGEDSRKTFTGHLYAALVQAGIHTFLDDVELPRGEEISEHLLKAIRESKISIVVFSKGYASSRWCLNELVEILKCKRKKTGQIVLPIFYDSDPSDVRKQNGSFAEAFVKHEERFEEKLVKEWRKALEEAGNLSGWNLNDMANGHEAEFIKKIIKDVLNKLNPKYLDVPEHLVGVVGFVRLARNIFDFRSTATDDVRIVGIHGMPGIGKTTLAKVVFNQLFKGFEGSCFLSDINETSKHFNGLTRLQMQLLKDILKQDAPNFDCADRGKVLIKERLCRKRVLVVADDVAHLDQLNALMGDRSWFGPRSRVIITTRDSNLLREADQTYQIEELKPDESLQLFSRHAFKDSKPAKDYIELSKKAVDYCGGLPLALKVIGALLYRKNRGRWEREIDNLSRVPNQDIQGKLLISYHALDGELQRAFLDIACFFIGIEKEYVAKVLGARCRLNPEVVLETLRERSLIQFHWRDERQLIGEMVAMHDLLRDMGREVVFKASPLHLGERTRIWNQEDAWNVLEQQKGTEVVEGLALDVRASQAKSLSAGSFAEMKCLNLLQINGVHLTGSFKLLSKELMWICWHECPLKYFPSDFTLDNLAVVDMQYSNLKELWKGKKILNRLKILNISHSQHLIKTPDLHSSSIEKLILKGCSSLVEVHQSIGNLTSLVFLNLEGCRSLKILPESICNVKSLETLNISGCSQLEKLPERMGDMESLTTVLADGIENEQFLSSIGQLKHVRMLSLCGYSSTPPSSSLISACVLKWKRLLPTPFIEWISVKCLQLSNCGLSDRATNCVDFGGLSALEELDLDGNKFSSLPYGLGFLPKLKRLQVKACKYLVSIPDLPSSLHYLFTSDCKSLKRVRIPSEPKIVVIRLDGSHSLEEFQGIEDLSNCFWYICVDDRSHSSSKLLKSVAETMCNGRHGYFIRTQYIPSEMPNWMSYRGEGCSLSFHIPPVFQGLVLCFDKGDKDSFVKIIIRNNSNGICLFKCTRWAYHPKNGWIRYTSRSKMAMEDYCADDELELSIYSRQTWYYCADDIKECGVHVIAGKSDSFEELAVRTNTVMPSPPLYHLLPHPHCGSITASTPKQWSDFLFAGPQLAGFVVGMFCTTMIDVANEFGVPSYVFVASSAAALSLMLYMQALNDEKNVDTTEFKDSDAEFMLPGIVNPVPAKVLPSVVFNKDWHPIYFGNARRFKEAEGIMVNTYVELESQVINAFSDGKTPPLYPIGPILNLKGDGHDVGSAETNKNKDIMEWLDDQPPSSVVFLCFGSMGSFSEEQLKEIASALEQSGYRFLWSVRQPPPQGKMGFPTDYANPEEAVPMGFLDRTAGIGKVIGWAPQVAILAHPAIGGFVSHCGWNSILESLWFGVPIAAWPLFSEQQLNAFEMMIELGLATEIKMDYRKDFRAENEVIVSADIIEKGIMSVMEQDSEVRKKVKAMSEMGKKALLDGGSSHSILGRLIEDMMNNLK